MVRGALDCSIYSSHCVVGVSTLFVCFLFCHTGAQYSAVGYTSLSAEVCCVFTFDPYEVSHSLCGMLFHEFIFAALFSRCVL